MVSIVQIQLAICCDLFVLSVTKNILCCYQIEQFYIVLFIEQLCILYTVLFVRNNCCVAHKELCIESHNKYYTCC